MYHILIVEDNLDIAALMKITLEKAGYAVDIANDGESGADRIEKKEYAVVLLDVMLPGIDGYELFPTSRNIPYRPYSLPPRERLRIRQKVFEWEQMIIL